MIPHPWQPAIGLALSLITTVSCTQPGPFDNLSIKMEHHLHMRQCRFTSACAACCLSAARSDNAAARLRLFVTNLKSWSQRRRRAGLLLTSGSWGLAGRFIRNIITNMSQVWAFNMSTAPGRNAGSPHSNYTPQRQHSWAWCVIY